MSKAEILQGKMPVTLLQELCGKVKSALPVYQYMGEEVSSYSANSKIFTHVVTAMGKQAKGLGRSKQESKHEAAWQLLRLLLELPMDEDDEKVAAAEDRNSLAAVELGTDHVNQVRDICIQRSFPLPEFELTRSYGPSHAPVFEYECRIRDIVRRGTYSTKKGAKQIACQEMVKLLQSMPVEESSMQLQTLELAIEQVEDSSENLIRTYREYTESDCKKKLGVTLAERHNFFVELPQDRVDQARQVLLDPNETLIGKCNALPQVLGLKVKVTISNPNMPTLLGRNMSTFELVHPDYDCLISGLGEKFYQNVYDYFDRMLKV